MRFITGTFDFADIGEVELKGKSEPIRLYRVEGLSAAPGRRRGLESVGLSSPMVGREAELEAILSAYAIVRAGRGRLAMIIGEPGIGKSRLLAELRAAVGRDDAANSPRWVEGRCVSYGRTIPYHLVLDMVHSLLGIPAAAPDTERRAVLRAALRELVDEEAADSEPYFAHMLALPLDQDETERTQLDPEVLQGRYVASLKRVITALAQDRPMVLVLEDIHWADPASVNVLLFLLPLITTQRVLVVCAGRAETDAPGWRLVTQAQSVLGPALTEVRLEPLNDDESRTLVSNLLEIEALPESVRDAILVRSEGNPFFVEEVIRMFIEEGAIERVDGRWTATDSILEIVIPDTLHGLLLARIDQLPDEAKRSLRVASVIGRQFPVRVLERVLTDG
jgi:predicted ATPase